MDECLDFLQHIYGIFGFTFNLKLSTRPEKYLGDLETWNSAEKCLEDALNKFGHPWELNPGDGAFYGPKIDITISDALKRRYQCATIQLDFQLPQRFDLTYRTDNPSEPFRRPVIIHRAILGSVERMTAILTENFAGKWPFWLNPRQIIVIPIASAYNDYATEIQQLMWNSGLNAEADLSELTLNKKIRNGEIHQWNFILVVGAEEEKSRSVNVRARDDESTKQKGEVRKVDDVLALLKQLNESKSLIGKI